ncbi:unnamed protein product [Schistocephalus solidus]|uniref:O-acyltransferase n=1 Tax=Schistocephalus solidus TaxID=70667 RepID=A0A183SX18_SCHSO|nr:unnamed protein product [Schistocephalus solidus]
MSDKMHSSGSSDCWLPEKSFKHRNSVLTDLFKISHIRSVYHIFVAILIIFSLNTMLSDLVEKGGIVHTYHLELFVWVFRGLYDAFVCWLFMFTSTSLLVYVAFLIWSTCRSPTPTMNKLDWFFIILYILYQGTVSFLGNISLSEEPVSRSLPVVQESGLALTRQKVVFWNGLTWWSETVSRSACASTGRNGGSSSGNNRYGLTHGRKQLQQPIQQPTAGNQQQQQPTTTTDCNNRYGLTHGRKQLQQPIQQPTAGNQQQQPIATTDTALPTGVSNCNNRYNNQQPATNNNRQPTTTDTTTDCNNRYGLTHGRKQLQQPIQQPTAGNQQQPTTNNNNQQQQPIATTDTALLTGAAFSILPVIFVFSHNLAPATSLIVIMEQTRMFMKSHAFIRTNAVNAFVPPEVAKLVESPGSHQTSYRNERFPSVAIGDGPAAADKELAMSNTYPLPSFSTYLYFLFAPTLIYSNSYPRTPYVRWRIVAQNFLQVGLCVIYNYYIFARFCFSHFANFGRSNHFTFSLRELVISSFGCMLPGTMVLLITFYAFLHCWLNAFAEMLRFGDRLFYKDWWNSFTFSAYYRGWNVVVHDWLYTYVYRDVYALCSARRRRFAAQAAVFMLSALVHEYILIVVFRFFYPVLFFIFGIAGFGIAHLKARSRFWNIGIWVGLFMGMGILMCLYSMEWYARLNCPPSPGGRLRDILLPRSWFCRRW